MAAVVFGAALLARHLKARPVRAGWGYGHAGLAVLGVLALGWPVFTTPTPLVVNAALLMFAFAVLGGVFVLLFRLQGERPPLFMVALHAVFAAVGVVLLGLGVLAGG
ncbi:hypothetical protein DEM34_11825 [Spiribacter halobius]|uniref:Uncharacterized protein n=1 Tax=Sediminicurvatus halobius TaxID=2182432 RepID=A0A2U2N087_9GAMM|nr:hypothetical protein DEM34_11825 [Spiribacter halobius]